MVAYRGTCLAHRAEILQLVGALPDARAAAESACQVLVQAGAHGMGEAHYRMAELARLRGDLQGAETAYARAAEQGQEVQPGLALLRLAQGRAGAAVAGLDRALAEASRPRQRALLLAARVEVALAAEARAEARGYAEELATIAAAMPADYLTALSEHAAGGCSCSPVTRRRRCRGSGGPEPYGRPARRRTRVHGPEP